MKRYLSLLTGVLALSLARGGDVPGFPAIEDWKLKVSPDVYYPDNLWDLINGAAESYLSYDFIELHLADYEDKTGVVVHAEIYRHSSAENAFGIYSSERNPEYTFLDIGSQAYLDEGILNFWTGPYYVKLYSTATGDDLPGSLRKIGRAVSDHLEQDNTWPAMLSVFPGEGRLENREHYIRENFIGLNFLHTAFTAEYEGGYKLFVIRGENREEILEMVRAYLEFTGQDIDPEETSSFTIRDQYNGDIPVILKGPCMTGILNGSEDAERQLELLVRQLPGN